MLARRQVGQQRQRHRGVEPDQVVVDVLAREVVGEQRLQHRQLVVVKAAGIDRRVRAHDLHAGQRRRAVEKGRGIGPDRLLDEDHAIVARQARQHVLRALKDEVPAQVGENDQMGHEMSWKGLDRKARRGVPRARRRAGVKGAAFPRAAACRCPRRARAAALTRRGSSASGSNAARRELACVVLGRCRKRAGKCAEEGAGGVIWITAKGPIGRGGEGS